MLSLISYSNNCKQISDSMNWPETINFSESKNVLKFEHGSENSKYATYRAQIQTPK